MTRASRSLASSSSDVRLVSWLNSSTFSAWRSRGGRRSHGGTFKNTAEQKTTEQIVGHEPLAVTCQKPQTPPPLHPGLDHAPSHPRCHGTSGRGQKMEIKKVLEICRSERKRKWKLHGRRLCVVWWHMQTEARSRLQPTNQSGTCMLESADATANQNKTRVEREGGEGKGGGVLVGGVPQISRRSHASAWLHASLHTDRK